ncbi:hypothetical protein OUZ56_007322 [Daphnia magna]|uniref:Uncharacterized protein n=1 Tax=Daphnia magna TaxID=35525 RepID=A0ABQ9YY91_9CRUS|nr:hypothetical protein OUZ56_007322 [Daphnia magna]
MLIADENNRLGKKQNKKGEQVENAIIVQYSHQVDEVSRIVRSITELINNNKLDCSTEEQYTVRLFFKGSNR